MLPRSGTRRCSIADAVGRVRDQELAGASPEALIERAGQRVEQVPAHHVIGGKLGQMLVGQIGGSVEELLVEGAEDLVSLAVLSPGRVQAIVGA